MLKHTVILFFVLLFFSPVIAQTNVPVGTPVSQDTMIIKLTNGETFQLIPGGDSQLHWLKTKDGYIVSKSDNQYFFGKIVNGEMTATNIQLSNKNLRSQKQLLERLKRDNFQALNTYSTSTKSVKTIGGVPSSGKIKIPVLLVEFADQAHTRSKENVEAMLNQDGHNNYASLQEFYKRASHDQLDIQFDVYGWYQSDLKLEEVAENNGGKAAGKLVRKAVQLANSEGIDFTPYDNDGDGDADVVVVMHAGLGADHYGQEEYIWPRSWALEHTVGKPLNYNDTEINDYVIACEMREYDNNWIEAGIGTFAHEFGHALGLPDLYDGTGKSNGLGHWALMSAGSWLGRGIKPSNFCVWSRIKLGWDSPKELNFDNYGDYMLNSSNLNKDEVYRINTTNEDEYFLLVNRRSEGNDIAQPTSGLAIYHINETKANLDYYVNDDRDNPGVRFVEADFNESLGLYNAQDRGTASDLFPGTTDNHEFGPNSIPSSNLLDGEESMVWIQDIKDENELITFSLSQVTGITSIDKTSDIIVYPNPVEDDIRIKGSLQALSDARIEIYSSKGCKLYEEKLNIYQNEELINLQFLAKGVYVIKIITEQEVYSKKILKY